MVEQFIFGTAEPAAIEDLVSDHCATRLGSPAAETLFRAIGVGAVFGLRLDDGRRVVLKAHQPCETAPRLRAAQAIQRVLWREGFPCPEPLCGPARLGDGLATAEWLLEAGERRDGHDPSCRRLVAEALAWQLELARGVEHPEQLVAPRPGIGGRAGSIPARNDARWLTELSVRARAQIVPSGGDEPRLAAHLDWSAAHFRFNGRRIGAVYGWEHLGLAEEASVVGAAAIAFTGEATRPDALASFLEDYSRARPTPLSAEAHRRAAGWSVLHAAAAGFTGALRDHGDAYLEA